MANITMPNGRVIRTDDEPKQVKLPTGRTINTGTPIQRIDTHAGLPVRKPPVPTTVQGGLAAKPSPVPTAKPTVAKPVPLPNYTGVKMSNPPVIAAKNPAPAVRPAQSKGGSFLGANALAGLDSFNKGLASTADFILPDVLTPKPLQKAIDYYKNQANVTAQRAAEVNKEKGVPQFAGELVQGTVAAIPNAAVALMSGGGSLGGQGISSASPLVKQVAAKIPAVSNMIGKAGTNITPAISGISASTRAAVQGLLKNPMFYTSAAQTMGNTYEEAKADGASELAAQATALISGFINAGVEVGGGIETIAQNPIKLKNWVSSMLDEGKEEVVQGIVEELVKKATYQQDKPFVSVTDQNAVVNPTRAAKEFAGGAAVGGILGGAQMGLMKGVQSINRPDPTIEEAPVNQPVESVSPVVEETIQEEVKPVVEPPRAAEIQTVEEPAIQEQPKFEEWKVREALQQDDDFNRDEYRAHKKDKVSGETSSILVRQSSGVKKTKDQWIGIANQLGKAAARDGVDVVETAYGAWNELHPNQKENLNRQGQRYVDFPVTDWVNAVKDGAVEERPSLGERAVYYPEAGQYVDFEQFWFWNPKMSYDEAWEAFNAKGRTTGLPMAKPTPQTIPQAGPKPLGIVADPQLVNSMQGVTDYLTPKENPAGNRIESGRSLDGLGNGENAFAPLQDLLVQSQADAAKKPKHEQRVAQVLTKRPVKGIKENFEITTDYLGRKLVDSGRTIDQIGKATGDDALYALYNNAKQARQAADFMLGDAQTDINGNVVGKSLNDVFDPIKAKGDDYVKSFSEYLFHLHNIDRMSLAFENSPEAAELKARGEQIYEAEIAGIEARNPKLEGKDVSEIEKMARRGEPGAKEWLMAKDSLDNLQNKPVFGESIGVPESQIAVADLLREHPEFAQMAEDVYHYNQNLMKYRVDAGLISQRQADIMRKLYPHYVPTFRDTSGTSGAKISGNRASIAKTVKQAKGSDLDLLRIDDSMAEQTMQTVRAAKQNLFATRLLEDALTSQDKVGRHIRSVIDKYNSYDMDEPPVLGNQVTLYVGGKPVSMDVDEGVMEAFKSIQPRRGESVGALGQVVKANNTFKALVTGWNPMFLGKNFFRDIQDAFLFTDNAKSFAKNYPKAWAEIKSNGKLWQLYKSMGGTGSSYFDYDSGLISGNNKPGKAKQVMNVIEDANMAVEQAPRFAEFLRVLEKEGASYEGIQKAMLAAADVTVNFGRSGSAVQFLNRTFVPFLNPAVQGTDKLVRKFANTKGAAEWTALAGKSALLGVIPALLNEMLWGDDEEYRELNDRDKENNYVFPIGDGVWAKIPKGRALSIFGSAARRGLETAKGNPDAWTGFISNAWDQVGFPNPLKENIISQLDNADLFDPDSPGKTWYGSDIEPQRLRSLPPGERYDEKTDALSKAVGGALNISPKKINYVLDSYSGAIGDFLLPMMTPRAERNPFAAAFSIDSVTQNRLSQDFYRTKDELLQEKNSRDPDPAARAAYAYLNRKSGEVSEINTQIREVENADIPNKQKKQEVRELRKQSNEIMRDALGNMEKFQEAAGEVITDIRKDLDTDAVYKSLSPEEQEKVIEKAYSYAGAMAEETIGDTDWDGTNLKIRRAESIGVEPAAYLSLRAKAGRKKDNYVATLRRYGYSDSQIAKLVELEGWSAKNLK